MLLAWGTHVLVDEPIRKGIRLHSPRLARVATAAVVIALGVGVFAATVGAEPALNGQVGQVADSSGPPTIPEPITDPNQSHPSLEPGTTSTSTPSALKVLVVGDSQAATLAQGVQAAPGVYGLSAVPGFAVWNRAILGCPIITYATFHFDGNDITNKCGGTGYWQKQWSADVAAFASRRDRGDGRRVGRVRRRAADGTIIDPGNPAWIAHYEQDVSALFDTLQATGAPVIAVKPPCWGENQVTSTDQQISERLDPRRVAAIDAVWTRAAAAHGTKLLDLDGTLCPGGTSDATIRPDGAHFYGSGSDTVAPLVAKAVRQAVAKR